MVLSPGNRKDLEQQQLHHTEILQVPLPDNSNILNTQTHTGDNGRVENGNSDMTTL